MKKQVWMIAVLCGLFIGCQVAGPGASWEVGSQKAQSLLALPALQQYPTNPPMPVGTFTHLVVGRCSGDGRFMAEAVQAPQGLIVARWVGSGAVASGFFTEAWATGVPVTVYTGRVTVEGATAPPPTGGTGTVAPPILDSCQVTVAGDIPDRDPEETGPVGDEHLWEIFSWLAIDTAQALDIVAKPPPAQ